MAKKRKTIASKKMIREIKEAKLKDKNTSSYKKKKTIIPGPWTEIETLAKVNVSLRENNGLLGVCYGTYPRDSAWHEPGWYPIIFNLTSDNICADVEKYGLDEYLASCERDLNSDKNRLIYGTVVFLQVLVDNSTNEDSERRFVSIKAKTNKKSITGFTAMRNGIYKVLE